MIYIDALSIGSGGGKRHLEELTKRLKEDRVEFRILISKRSYAHWPNSVVIDTVNVNAWRLFTSRSFLKNQGCSHLFVPGGIYLGFFRDYTIMLRNSLPYEWKRIPNLSISLISRYLTFRFIQSLSFYFSKQIILLNKNSLQFIRKGDQNKCFVIPHGVDCHNTSWSPKTRIQTIVFVSNYREYKRHTDLVTALNRIGFSGTLILVGFSDEDRENFLRDFGSIGYNVVFEYYEDSKLMFNKISTSDLAVFLSICENMPNTLLEKLAIGIPTITYDIKPMSDYNKISDFIVSNTEELELLLSKLILNGYRQEDLRSYKLLSNIIRERYTWDKTYKSTLELLAQ